VVDHDIVRPSDHDRPQGSMVGNGTIEGESGRSHWNTRMSNTIAPGISIDCISPIDFYISSIARSPNPFSPITILEHLASIGTLIARESEY